MPNFVKHGSTGTGSIGTSLEVFIKYLGAMKEALPAAKENYFFLIGSAMEVRLRALQPRVTGTFASGWRLGNLSQNGFEVWNDVPYAHVLEGGVLPGNKPWPQPTKRVVEFEGRHWSRKAPGGNLRKTMLTPYNFENRITKGLADTIVGVVFEGKFPSIRSSNGT